MATPLPAGSCTSAYILGNVLTLSRLATVSAACFPCRERKLKAYCVLPCARQVVYLELILTVTLGGSFPVPTLWLRR